MHSYFSRSGPLAWLMSCLLPLALHLDDGDGGGGGAGEGGQGDGGQGGGDGGQGGGQGGEGSQGGGQSGGGQQGGGKPNLLSKGGQQGGGQGQGQQGGQGQGGQGGQGQGGQGQQKPNTTPFYADLYGPDGKLNHAAFDRLPDHLKPHVETFKKYQTVEALLGGMGNLANLAGKKALAPLPANAPAELKAERQALMRQLNGTPEKAEGYGVKKPANIPPEMWDDAYVNDIVGVLHKHNASPDLVRELLTVDSKHATSRIDRNGQTEAQAYAKEETALREAFGPRFNEKVDLAIRGARTLGLDPNDPIFRNHKVVVAMSRFAEMVSEDKLVSGDEKGGSGLSDRQKARDIVMNPANPLHAAYHDPNHAEHESAVRTHSEFNKRHAATQKARR